MFQKLCLSCFSPEDEHEGTETEEFCEVLVKLQRRIFTCTYMNFGSNDSWF